MNWLIRKLADRERHKDQTDELVATVVGELTKPLPDSITSISRSGTIVSFPPRPRRTGTRSTGPR